MMKRILTLLVLTAAVQGVLAERIDLSGKGPSDAVEWDFKCSDGRRSGEWTKIPVPSNWEQHGFGGYDYGHTPPNGKHAETGTYRVKFQAPEVWEDKTVRLVFEGSMTDTSIKLNGKPVGAMNQGGYNQFHFLLTSSAFKVGQENELEVLVAKKSANESLEFAERKADYWVFGGIYRPVYLEILPKAFVNRVAIDARADGGFRMHVYPQVHIPSNRKGQDHVDELVAQIETLDGKTVGTPMTARLSGDGVARVKMNTQVEGVQLWSPEHPNLYQVRVALRLKGKTLHEKVDRFGFRTIELRPEDGLYLNGKKFKVRGVNRNGFRPDTARALDPEEEWEDARAIKAMNANTVRCHLPPTTAFLEACDELGLLFISERTNWQQPVADTAASLSVVHDLVTRNHNHPSMVIWANGNENGFNHELNELFVMYDLQERPVIYPFSVFDRIDTLHYPSYGDLDKRLTESTNVVLPTEFLHGLYDGGHGAGLDDFWNLMLKSPLSAGGVLWCWDDAAIERTDQNGKLDTAGNYSADGIVGSYGEKEGSYHTIREIWSPIQISLETLPADFDGKLPVENRFDQTSLSECAMQWRLMNFTADVAYATGRVRMPELAPGQSGVLDLSLPADWHSCDMLELVATDPRGREMMHWSWATGGGPTQPQNAAIKPELLPGNPIRVKMGDTLWTFSPDDGRLISCLRGGKETGFANGPVLHAATDKEKLSFDFQWKARVTNRAGAVMIESEDGAGSRFAWTLSPGGTVELSYEFAPINEPLTYCAVGLDLDEANVAAKQWYGDGPFRVWANRRKGPRYGLWQNEYNDGITGVNWIYPEFKGVFANVDWMGLALKSGGKILLDTAPGSDIGVLRPHNASTEKSTNPQKATWSYPEEGGLYVFHKIPAVGTKFNFQKDLGPQSTPQTLSGPIKGTLKIQIQ